jgi:hypothetical protein
MKLLLDESVPRGLEQHFPSDFDVSTVQENGWVSVKNGALLRLAADGGFEALITADKGFAYQHNQETLPVPVSFCTLIEQRLSIWFQPCQQLLMC